VIARRHRRVSWFVVLGATQLSLAAPAFAEAPAVDYMLHCRGCHLADGSGAPGRVPDFRNQVGRFLQVAGGREYLIRVPGSAQSPLDDAALAAVLNWIVEAFGPAEVANRFDRFGAEEVARHRGSPLVEVEERRAALLEQLQRAERAPKAP
jgi:hypothetical protein